MLVPLAFAISIFCTAGLAIYAFIRFKSETVNYKLAESHLMFGLAASGVLNIWLGAWVLMPFVYKTVEKAGPAGDMFGGITALFSWLAFAGLISTLLMQKEELKSQRKELTDTRKEFERQRFEQTLFSIIDLLVGHTTNLRIATGAGDLRGRAVLDYFASELMDEFVIEIEADGLEYFNVNFYSLGDQIESYENLFAVQFEADLGPYFRLLYNAIRHIEKSEMDCVDKLGYSKIVRAHLSSAELKLLFFNCLSSHGEGFKGWIEKYSLLKHVSQFDRKKNPMLEGGIGSGAFSAGTR